MSIECHGTDRNIGESVESLRALLGGGRGLGGT